MSKAMISGSISVGEPHFEKVVLSLLVGFCQAKGLMRTLEALINEIGTISEDEYKKRPTSDLETYVRKGREILSTTRTNELWKPTDKPAPPPHLEQLDDVPTAPSLILFPTIQPLEELVDGWINDEDPGYRRVITDVGQERSKNYFFSTLSDCGDEMSRLDAAILSLKSTESHSLTEDDDDDTSHGSRLAKSTKSQGTDDDENYESADDSQEYESADLKQMHNTVTNEIDRVIFNLEKNVTRDSDDIIRLLSEVKLIEGVQPLSDSSTFVGDLSQSGLLMPPKRGKRSLSETGGQSAKKETEQIVKKEEDKKLPILEKQESDRKEEDKKVLIISAPEQKRRLSFPERRQTPPVVDQKTEQVAKIEADKKEEDKKVLIIPAPEQRRRLSFPERRQTPPVVEQKTEQVVKNEAEQMSKKEEEKKVLILPAPELKKKLSIPERKPIAIPIRRSSGGAPSEQKIEEEKKLPVLDKKEEDKKEAEQTSKKAEDGKPPILEKKEEDGKSEQINKQEDDKKLPTPENKAVEQASKNEEDKDKVEQVSKNEQDGVLLEKKVDQINTNEDKTLQEQISKKAEDERLPILDQKESEQMDNKSVMLDQKDSQQDNKLPTPENKAVGRASKEEEDKAQTSTPEQILKNDQDKVSLPERLSENPILDKKEIEQADKREHDEKPAKLEDEKLAILEKKLDHISANKEAEQTSKKVEDEKLPILDAKEPQHANTKEDDKKPPTSENKAVEQASKKEDDKDKAQGTSALEPEQLDNKEEDKKLPISKHNETEEISEEEEDEDLEDGDEDSTEDSQIFSEARVVTCSPEQVQHILRIESVSIPAKVEAHSSDKQEYRESDEEESAQSSEENSNGEDDLDGDDNLDESQEELPADDLEASQSNEKLDDEDSLSGGEREDDDTSGIDSENSAEDVIESAAHAVASSVIVNASEQAAEELILSTEQEEPNQPSEEELDTFDLKVIFVSNRTGFEESKDFPIKINTIIAKRYQIVEYIGSAAFSKAVQCLDLITGQLVCVKIIKNNKDFFDQSLDEIKLLKYINCAASADRKNVVQLLNFFYYKEHLFLVFELLRDNLYEFYKFNRESSNADPYFTMPRLQRITRQALVALDFIHSLKLIHCDLKPENILIKSYSRCEIKVIDFGSSCFTTDNVGSYVQSRSYRAPEVLLGCSYDQKIDLWSLGCIIAELWTGSVLFMNESIVTLLARVLAIIGPIPLWMLQKGKYASKYFNENFTHLCEVDDKKNPPTVTYLEPKKTNLRNRLKTSDALFVDFLSKLLQVDPHKRASAREALQHPWLFHNYNTQPTTTAT